MLRRAIFSSALSGAPPVVQANTLGLNGTSQYLSVADDPSLDIADDLIISCFVKLNGKGDFFGLVGKWNTAGNKSYLLLYDKTTDKFQIALSNDGSASTDIVSTTTPALSTWYHVAIVYDSNTNNLSIWVNGVNEANTTHSGGLFVGTENLRVGALNAGAFLLDGDITQVHVLNSSDTSLISELYNLGVSRQPQNYSSAIKTTAVLALPLNNAIASGRAFEDFSGFENDATLVGAPSINGSLIDLNPGLVYNSAKFNGSSSYISIADSDDFNLGTAFTHLAWIKLDSIGASNYIYAQLEDSDEFIIFEVLSTGKLHLQCYNVSELFDFQSTATLVADRWYQVGFQVDGSTAKIIIDGAFDPTTDAIASTPPNYIAGVEIGRWPGGGNYFAGGILQPMTFQSVLSIEEIKSVHNFNVPQDFSLMPQTILDKCQMCLEMTSNDSTFVDLSTNGTQNDGTNNNVTFDGPEIDWSNSNSIIDAKTLSLNGSNYLIVSDSASLDTTTALTLMGWIKIDTAVNNEAFFSKWNTSVGDLSYLFQSLDIGKVLSFVVSNDGSASTSLDSVSTISPDTWYHVAARYDGSTLKIFINGVEDASVAYSAGIHASAEDLRIGSVRDNAGTTSYFDGSMALMGAFNLALTNQEILDSYNNSIGQQPWLLPQSIKNNAVLLLALNEQTDSNEYNDYSGNNNNATPVNSPTLTGADLTIETNQDPGP